MAYRNTTNDAVTSTTTTTTTTTPEPARADEEIGECEIL